MTTLLRRRSTASVVAFVLTAAMAISGSAYAAPERSEPLAASTSTKVDETGLDATGLAVNGADRLLVRFASGAVPAAYRRQALSAPTQWRGRSLATSSWISIENDPILVAELLARADVELIGPDLPVEAHRPQGVGAATQTDPPWGLDRIDQRTLPLDQRFTAPNQGAGVRVYVVDDGIYREHPDFTGRVVSGYFDTAFPSDSDLSCSSHGSHVAGTVGGQRSGVAKQATLVPIRVLDCRGRASTGQVVLAIDWILANHPPNSPGVVNMSFGGQPNAVLDSQVNRLIDAGITVIASAGNDGTDACGSSPARVARAITVGATSSNDARASFSNFGSCIDIWAPGVAISSVATPSGFRSSSGTSMAAPHAAGAAALLLSANPALRPAELMSLLRSAATPGVVTAAGTGSPRHLLFVGAANSNPPPPPGPDPVPPTPPPPPSVSPVSFDPADTAYAPINPARIVDTRSSGKVAAGREVLVVDLSSSLVPTDTRAVALNVTVVDPDAAGFVSLVPCSQGVPTTSNVNFVGGGGATPNAVVTPIPAGGRLCAFTSSASHLIIDLVGMFRAESSLTTLQPRRALDTRGQTRIPRLQPTPIPLDRIVGTEVGAVLLNVTAINPQSDGYLSIIDCAAAPPPGVEPSASNLNYRAGQTIANLVVASSANACVVSSSSTDVLVDVFGSFPRSSEYRSINPQRLADTRGANQPSAGSVTQVTVNGRAGVSASTRAAVVNVTAVGPAADGFVTVYGCGSPRPNASTVNFRRGVDRPNAAIVELDATGRICLYTSAPTHLIVDIGGRIERPSSN